MTPIDSTAASRDRRERPALRYGLPGVALGAALVLAIGSGGSARLQAESGPLATAQGGLMAVPLPNSADPGSSRLLLIDPRAQALAVYRIDGFKNGTIKLEAARQFAGDLRLSEYNNLPPEVAAVEAMVAAPRQRGNPRP